MDSKTITPAAPDPLAAMLHNAAINKVEKSEFNNSARDNVKLTVNNCNFTKEGENLILEPSDVIDCVRNAVQPFLAEVRKNDQSRSTDGDTTSAHGSDPVPKAITTDHTVEDGPVEVIDLVPSETSSLRVASVADRYTRSMLKCLTGYPLYEPQPFSELSREYMRHGVNVGDVTLEKISDSSNVLDEGNRTLQGTEIQALQAPLTTPDDDYTPSPTTISVILPRELVERILLLLDTESILTCRLANREFNYIIQSSTLLQYFLACKAAGVIDNPKSPLSYAERLEALSKREDAWKSLKPVFEMTIDGKHQTTASISRLTEGVYFITDDDRKDLNCYHLPSFPQDNSRWIKIPPHGPALNWSGILVKFAIALYEHDLIVNFISSDIENQVDMQRHSLDLVILKFSTGGYHPLARRPRIHVQRSPEVKPLVVSVIVGDNLALVVHSNDSTFSDKLFIFDWKTGRKLLQHEITENAYFTVDFISPELLLVPNLNLSHFEVWYLPPSHPNAIPPAQILSLQIPAVSPEYFLFSFGCHAEPNPYLHSLPYLPPRPFFSSPENSIIIAKLKMSSNSHPRASYDLIMHRCTLLDTIQTWTSPSLLEQQEYLPRWMTNEVNVSQIADPEDGSVELDAQSKLVSTMPHWNPSSGPSSLSSGLSTNSRCTFLLVPWTEWGPPISRWFQPNETQAWWFGHYNGQRYAFSDPSLHDPRKLIINVADLNPHNFRRNAEMMVRLRSGKREDNGSNVNNEESQEEEELETLDHKGVFSEVVHMGLKCVVYRALDEYDFDVLLMDEERLLGVKLNREGRPENIKVLYIG